MIPVRALFESHLRVADLGAAMAFYGNVLGLKVAHKRVEPAAAFYWVGGRGQSMLGLWEGEQVPAKGHLAFRVDLPDLVNGVQRLKAANVVPLDLEGRVTEEPVVQAWMPAASICFKDPDGNMLEFMCLLGDRPMPELGVVSWTAWLNRGARAGVK